VVDASHTLSMSGGPVMPATIVGTVAKAGSHRRSGCSSATTRRSRRKKHGPAIIAKLAELAGVVPGIAADSQGVQVAAMKELLDRRYGRATFPLTGDADAPLVAVRFEWAPASTEPVHEPQTINGDGTAVIEFTGGGGDIVVPRG
jgi:hypothetical protein